MLLIALSIAAVAMLASLDRLAVAQVGTVTLGQGAEEILPPPLPQPAAQPERPVAPARPTPTASADPIGARGVDEPSVSAASELEYEVLMQGPVHEAFAVPTDADPTAGVRLYSEAPPKPIAEKPPEDASPGAGVTWIPGYWSWSDDANKYVWVSGLYRKAPPGRSWVPGYWSERTSGYRWTSGFWTPDQSTSGVVEYLPVPPSSIDNGPSVPPPNDDYFWLPGQWEYVDGQYQWRSGYWTPQQEGWIWQPACYVNSPGGFVSVDGYWDALPPQRGQLYAPVSFYGSAFQQPGYVYRPRYPLASAAAVLLHLFTRPGYASYYYGDFYGPSYAAMGYRPWYDQGFGFGNSYGNGFNSPWLGYYNWNYRRSGIDFVGSMQRYNDFYRANPQQRPQKQLKFDRQGSSGSSSFANVSQSAKGNPSHRSLDDMVRSDVGGKAVKRIDEKSQGNAWRNSESSIAKGNRPSVNSQSNFSSSFDKGSSKSQSSKLPNSNSQSSKSNRGSPDFRPSTSSERFSSSPSVRRENSSSEPKPSQPSENFRSSPSVKREAGSSGSRPAQSSEKFRSSPSVKREGGSFGSSNRGGSGGNSGSKPSHGNGKGKGK